MADQVQNPAGWKKDPTGRHFGRYWDGEEWTEHVISSEKVQSVDPMPLRPEPPLFTDSPPPVPPRTSPAVGPEAAAIRGPVPTAPSGARPPVPPPQQPAPVIPAAQLDPKGKGRNQVVEAVRGWPRWAQVTLGLFVVLVVIAAAAGGEDDKKTVSATGGQAATTQATLNHTPASIPPTVPAPTPPPTVATTTTTTTPPQPVTVATFTGSSDKTTDTFAVRNPWRLRWTITGGAGVGIAIHDQNGARIQYLSTDPGSDESVVRRGCTCYLVISPFGSSYTITVNGIAG